MSLSLRNILRCPYIDLPPLWTIGMFQMVSGESIVSDTPNRRILVRLVFDMLSVQWLDEDLSSDIRTRLIWRSTISEVDLSTKMGTWHVSHIRRSWFHCKKKSRSDMKFVKWIVRKNIFHYWGGRLSGHTHDNQTYNDVVWMWRQFYGCPESGGGIEWVFFEDGNHHHDVMDKTLESRKHIEDINQYDVADLWWQRSLHRWWWHRQETQVVYGGRRLVGDRVRTHCGGWLWYGLTQCLQSVLFDLYKFLTNYFEVNDFI